MNINHEFDKVCDITLISNSFQNLIRQTKRVHSIKFFLKFNSKKISTWIDFLCLIAHENQNI